MAEHGNPKFIVECDEEEDGDAKALQDEEEELQDEDADEDGDGDELQDEEEDGDGDGKELQNAIEASLDDHALQLQLEEVMAFSHAFHTSQLQLEEEPTASKSQLQVEEEPRASNSANVPSPSNSSPASSTTPSENDDPIQDSVGKRPGSGNISVPSPKRARREGKEVVEGSEDAPLVKEQCSICLEAKCPSEFFDGMVCWHRFCSTCIVLHIRSKLEEKLVTIYCPEPNCSEYLSPLECQLILPKQTLEDWCLALVEEGIPSSQRFYCPFKDCSALLLKDVPEEGSSNGAAAVVIKESECPECKRLFCAQCGVPWHVGLDCSDLEKLSPSEKEDDDLLLFKLAKEKDWQRCEKCKRIVEKTSGCCHMICRCGHEFCYKCGSMWKNDRVPCKCVGWEER